MLPIVELRLGLPIILEHAVRNNLSIPLHFSLAIIVNIFAIIIAFFFLDFIHEHLLKIKLYKKFAEKHLEKARKKAAKIEKKMSYLGFFALMAFVSVPLPGTGAWSGALISWILNLDRKKSIIAIAAGIIIAGIIILLSSLSLFGFLL